MRNKRQESQTATLGKEKVTFVGFITKKHLLYSIYNKLYLKTISITVIPNLQKTGALCRF